MAIAMLINRTKPTGVTPTSGSGIGEWEYTTYSSTIYLTKYIGGGGDIYVPEQFTISGTIYNTQIGDNRYGNSVTNVFGGHRGITSVTIPENISFTCASMNGMFDGCSNLKYVNLGNRYVYNL